MIMSILFRMTLYIAVLPYVALLGALAGCATVDIYSIHTFHKTYIESIDLPSYGLTTTSKILQDFNSLADNRIITFDKIENGRPIRIYEMSELQIISDPTDIGQAYVGLDDCVIYIRKGLSYRVFRETLLHEYLHCMGYDHVPDRNDLMYYSANYVDKEENIRQYALRVLEKYYE